MSASDNRLFGFDEIIMRFSSLCKEGKLSHAYIFEGPRGSGKKTLSRFIAEELVRLSGVDVPDISVCPDLRLISREEGKKNISIEAVRAMIDDSCLTPSVLDFKLYIFDGADTLSPQAQNALLKVIEEPPEKVYIFLLCASSASLLTTVKSRAQRIVMPLFDFAEIRAYLEKKHPDVGSDKISLAAKLCGGAVGYAEEILSNEASVSLFEAAKKIIDAQSEKGRSIKYFDFISLVSKSAQTKDSLSDLISYLFVCYRELLLSKMSGTDKNVFFSSKETEKYISTLSLEAMNESINVLSGISSDSAYNFNITLAAQALAVLLWNAA